LHAADPAAGVTTIASRRGDLKYRPLPLPYDPHHLAPLRAFVDFIKAFSIENRKRR